MSISVHHDARVLLSIMLLSIAPGTLVQSDWNRQIDELSNGDTLFSIDKSIRDVAVTYDHG
jgi:hypothetical protein